MTDGRPVVTLFYCVNALSRQTAQDLENAAEFEIRPVHMACSSMVKDVLLLKGFEAGADLVVVATCPPGQCQFIDGNSRARKRVERVRRLMDEAGLEGRRLIIIDRGLELEYAGILKEFESALE
ncbi:MAG: hydrogenase iron-sulfur subunit [Dehalococcoidaceae bacterium]|nr:hydrogenase iron-sulfur subunit [Dehalococcoidaceae bacterium]